MLKFYIMTPVKGRKLAESILCFFIRIVDLTGRTGTVYRNTDNIAVLSSQKRLPVLTFVADNYRKSVVTHL